MRSPWNSALPVGQYRFGGGVDLGAGSGKDPAFAKQPTIDDWRRWIAENLLRRCDPPTIIESMLHAGIDEPTARREVEAATNHPYLNAARQLGVGPGASPRAAGAKLAKRDWVLECYRRAARQAGSSGVVPRLAKLPRQQFLDEHYALSRPVVMTGAMEDWPAMTRWTPQYLKDRFSERSVSVQANRTSDANYEQNSERLRRQMPFGEFVDLVESVAESNDYYITANNAGTNREALKELWEDVVLFPEYLRSDDPANRGFFWYGPKGTITPLHHDLTNNFMAQVRGRKLVRLVAPYELPALYNNRHCSSRWAGGTTCALSTCRSR